MANKDLALFDASLDEIQKAPATLGRIELIVRRPKEGEREILEEGILSLEEGLVGDNWKDRPSSRTKDGSPHPEMQLNLINSRVSKVLADDLQGRALCGDQLHLDLDLGEANLPPGTRLEMGSAELEITAEPHTGCKKFAERFGLPALEWVSTKKGRSLRLRGVNAKVVRAGTIHVGDVVRKLT